jgi:hypothetical protein
MRPMMTGMWTHSEEWATGDPLNLEGFEVAATDGEIGRIDDATYEVGTSYIVVDTGPWIFGRKVLLPAGMIERIDLDNKRVEVRLNKEQIKNSPEYDPDTEDYRSDAYRERIDTYYAPYHT